MHKQVPSEPLILLPSKSGRAAAARHSHILTSAAGWCIFNDLAVAVRVLQKRSCRPLQALFVDLDVHQGDGTAAIFAEDPSVFTFSMHCAAQPFPHQGQNSDLDVALPAGTTDDEYMQASQALAATGYV